MTLDCPTAPRAKPERRARPRLKLLDALADAAIALLRRVLPKNFGVDLEPPGARLRAAGGRQQGEAEGLRARAAFDQARPFERARPHHGARAVRGLCRARREAARARPQPRSAADAENARPTARSPAQGPIFWTATARSSPPTSRPCRCSPSRTASSTSTRRSNSSPPCFPTSTRSSCASGSRSKKGFIWVKRQITPKEQAEIFHLGLPGVGFLPENKRIYPNGPIGAYVIGYVDKDNVGIAGMEKYLDQQSLTDPHVAGFAVDPDLLKPVRLSIDLKATHALRDELVDGMDRFHAKAAAGMIIDVNTGEVIALESLPDFDPNDPERRARPEQDQPHQCRRLRDGLDLQGAFARHGARIRQGQRSARMSTRATACATGASPSTIFTPPIAC